MKKNILLGFIVILIVALISGLGYYYFFKGSDYGDPRPPKDLTGIIVPPVELPLNGKTFFVPDQASTSVTLNLISPTAKRDYPMGKFLLTGSSTSEGTLVALDDFVTAYENNLRAVPIAVNQGGSGEFFYLAVLEGDDMKHIQSLPLGDRIKIQSITRTGDQVTVQYFVHDRNQAMVETPSVATTAVFDIVKKAVVQAGRDPMTEEYHEAKSFMGEYLWQSTVSPDGKKITPTKADMFTLLFDANQIVLGTDCNTGGSTYTAETGSSSVFTIGELAITKKFCEAGQEADYFAMFSEITNYTEPTEGIIKFTLSDKSVMTFVSKKQKLEFESATSSETISE